MRTIVTRLLSAVILLAAATAARADDADQRSRQVRVALALAASKPEVQPIRADEQQARTDAIRSHKPMVLIVGMDAAKAGKQAASAGAVPVSVKDYKSDERGTEQRIVVLEPRPDKQGFKIAATLKPDATADEVRTAVIAATPRKLDWTMP